MIGIIIGIVVILIIFIIIFSIYSNKFHFAIIKIEKAEEDIDMYLQKKKDLLDRTRPIIKKELKLKSFLTELDDDLSDALVSILDNLNDNEEQIVGAIKFYNDTVVDFNQLVMSFPANMVAFIKRYKKKSFYNNEKREIFEILNEK